MVYINTKKIAFLFGAGADSVFNISTGCDFAESVIGSKNSYYTDAINEFFKGRKICDWYPKYTSEKSITDNQLLRASIEKKFLTQQEFSTQASLNEQIDNELEVAEKDTKKKHYYLDNYPSYFGIIDKKFHTLLNPKVLGSKNFWFVVRCYFRGYLNIMISLLEISNPSKKDCLDILYNPYKSYVQAVENCKKHLRTTLNYYVMLKDSLGNNCKIISSNYTPYLDILFPKEQVAYVHGKLNWFESARDILVYEIDESFDYEDDVRFPYILLQSALKPIIESKQIAEFSKANAFIEQSDVLVILGFALNIDDNHLNSMIKSFLERPDTKLIVFGFDDFDIERVNLVLRSKYSKEKIIIIQINKENCLSEFKNFLLEASK